MDQERKTKAPIVVDLGSASRKRIRQLKRGEGKLEAEVREVLAQVSAQLGSGAGDVELVPVVVVYTRRRKRSRSILDLVL